MEITGQILAPAELTEEKIPRYPLCGHHSRSGCFEEQKHFLPFKGFEPQIVQPQPCHYKCGLIYSFFFHGSTAPSGPGPPQYRGFTITHSDTPHSLGLLWTSDQPVTETLTTHNTHTRQTSMPPPPGGIRTRNPSKRTAADPRLRHCDRLTQIRTSF
jgi:hypothetical protein